MKVAPVLVVLLLLTARSALAQDLQPPPPMAPFPQQQQQQQQPPQYGGPQYGTQPQYGSQYSTQPQQPMPQSNGSATTQQLEAAEREDSGRGLEFFYATAGVGGTYLGLEALSKKGGLGLERPSGGGVTADFGLGLRLLTFSVGPRARFSDLPGFTLWQVDLEAAMHIPYGKIDGYFGAHGGYAFTGKISESSTIPPSPTSVHGLDLGLQAGTTYYVSPNFSLGAELGGQTYFLSSSSGSSVGLGGQLAAHLGLHF